MNYRNFKSIYYQVGVFLLIAGYMLVGAAVFQMIESDSRVGLAVRAIEAGDKTDLKTGKYILYI